MAVFSLGFNDERFWGLTPRIIFHHFFSYEYGKIKEENRKVAKGDDAIKLLKGFING